MRIREFLQQHAGRDAVAVVQGQRQITYRQLHERCVALASWLQQRKEQNIALYLPNSISYVVAYFGVVYAGKTLAPISRAAKQQEVLATVENCDVRLVLTDTANLAALEGCREGKEQAFEIWNIDDCTQPRGGLRDAGEPDIALMIGTSATTDNPKRVMLSSENLYGEILAMSKVTVYTPERIALISLPMTGIIINSQFLQFIYVGMKIVIMESFFTVKNFFKMVEKERITHFTCTPPLLVLLSRFSFTGQYDISSLHSIAVGGAGAPKTLLNRLRLQYPTVLFSHGYGMTETASVITLGCCGRDIPFNGSVGQPLPGVQIRIMAGGKEAPLGEPGEIVVKSDTVMAGYYNNEEATKSILQDGWLHTGDIGRMDEHNNLYIIGRKKSMINSGGLSIFPEEVEEILLSHPHVVAARAYGEKDELLDETVAAEVVADGEVTAEELKKHCKQHLMDYKVPRSIYFVEDIMRTEIGKVKRILA